MKSVIFSYLKTVTKLLATLVIAGFLAFVFQSKTAEWLTDVLSVFGVLLIATAGLDKLRRPPESWKGETPSERLDRSIFSWLFYLGIFIEFFAWWIKLFPKICGV